MNQIISVIHTNKGYTLKVNGTVAVETSSYMDMLASVKSRAAEFDGQTTVRFD